MNLIVYSKYVEVKKILKLQLQKQIKFKKYQEGLEDLKENINENQFVYDNFVRLLVR